MLDVAPQKPLRADEPVTQIDELGLRRVTTHNPAGAVGIETRVHFWCGLVAAAPASVSLHSVVGPQQSCCSLPKRCWCNRGRTPLGSMFGSSVTGRGPIQAERGPTCAAARRIGSMTYRNNLVLRGRRGCPSSPCSSPGRAEGSSWSLRFHECRNFLTSNACCFRHR